MDVFIGTISTVGFNFAPQRWASCAGQFINISENQALFALLGTAFGGDGRTIFALPDMRGRAAIGMGTGIGLEMIGFGQALGMQTNKLNDMQLPSHSHSAVFTPQGGNVSEPLKAIATVNAKAGVGDESQAGNNTYWATPTSGRTATTTGFSTSKDVTLANDAVTIEITGDSGGITNGSVDISNSGDSREFSTQSPSLGVNYIISLDGVFPPRN